MHPTSTLQQQYAHYHTKWEQAHQDIDGANRWLTNPQRTDRPYWLHELRLAMRRARYANTRMCNLETQHIANGGQIGSLTWVNMYPAVQDGYIIPSTPSMYQDD